MSDKERGGYGGISESHKPDCFDHITKFVLKKTKFCKHVTTRRYGFYFDICLVKLIRKFS